LNPITRTVRSVLNITHYCKRPPKRENLGLPIEEHHKVETFLDAVRHYIVNQLISTFSDTVKVNFQRLAVLHIVLFRIANAMLGELTSPAHTIAGSAGGAISSLKSEVQRMITQLALVISKYKRDSGQLSEADKASTDYELVIHNLTFIDTHKEALKATGLAIGAPYLWKEDDLEGREKFITLLDANVTDLMKQLHAIYFYSLIKSLSWTLPMTLFIGLMPYILNAAGNDVLMGEKFIALIFAMTPLCTVATAMNHSLVSIFDHYIQYRLSAVEILVRDLPQIGCSAAGWYFQSPYLIAIGQLVPSILTAAIGSKMILTELNKVPREARHALNQQQKKNISTKILKNVFGVGAEALFRMLVPFVLGLRKEHIAILTYNLFYFLVWGFLGIFRASSQGYNYGRAQHAYDGHEKTLDSCLILTNTMLSVIMASVAAAVRNDLIPLINASTTPEAIKANKFGSEGWMLGCFILATLGASYVQKDKIGNAYDQRVKLAMINVLPGAIGFFALYHLGGNTQLIGLMVGWLMSSLITITYGLYSQRFQGDLPVVVAVRRRHQDRNPHEEPLLAELRAEGKAEEKLDEEDNGIVMTAIAERPHHAAAFGRVGFEPLRPALAPAPTATGEPKIEEWM
jgi:hypothetical protein